MITPEKLSELKAYYSGPQKAMVGDKTVCLQLIEEDRGHIVELVEEIERLRAAVGVAIDVMQGQADSAAAANASED